MFKHKPAIAPSPSLEYGRVQRAGSGGMEITTSFGLIPAVRAVGCLVEPGIGDKVLLSVDTAGDAYVLSVLESAAPVTLCVDGDTRLRTRGGSLTVTSDGDLNLSSAGTLAASSETITLAAGRAQAAIGRLGVVGEVLKTQFQRVRNVAASMDQAFKRFSMRAQESSRHVSEHDEVQAGSRRVLVEDLCALHAKNHSMMAEEQVVINADQIHMG